MGQNHMVILKHDLAFSGSSTPRWSMLKDEEIGSQGLFTRKFEDKLHYLGQVSVQL